MVWEQGCYRLDDVHLWMRRGRENLIHCGFTVCRSTPSLASCVACMMTIVGVCFLSRSCDCLWHKQHFCENCGEKVLSFFLLIFYLCVGPQWDLFWRHENPFAFLVCLRLLSKRSEILWNALTKWSLILRWSSSCRSLEPTRATIVCLSQ